MWKVEFENTKVQIEVERLIKSGHTTKADEEVIAAWIRQISLHGPESVQADRKWSDHGLEDEWAGHRSSSFSTRGRIIYRIEEKTVKVKVVRITDIHNYKKERS